MLWFGIVRLQAITWTNVDSDLYHNMVLLHHNELINDIIFGKLQPYFPGASESRDCMNCWWQRLQTLKPCRWTACGLGDVLCNATWLHL